MPALTNTILPSFRVIFSTHQMVGSKSNLLCLLQYCTYISWKIIHALNLVPRSTHCLSIPLIDSHALRSAIFSYSLKYS